MQKDTLLLNMLFNINPSTKKLLKNVSFLKFYVLNSFIKRMCRGGFLFSCLSYRLIIVPDSYEIVQTLVFKTGLFHFKEGVKEGARAAV